MDGAAGWEGGEDDFWARLNATRWAFEQKVGGLPRPVCGWRGELQKRHVRLFINVRLFGCSLIRLRKSMSGNWFIA